MRSKIADGAMPFPGWEPFEGPDSADLDDETKRAIASAAIPVPEGVAKGTVPAGGIESRRIVHNHVAVVRDQHVEQADKLRGRGFDRGRRIGSSQQLQAATVAGHKALQQGTIHAVEVAGGVAQGEQRLQI